VRGKEREGIAGSDYTGLVTLILSPSHTHSMSHCDTLSLWCFDAYNLMGPHRASFDVEKGYRNPANLTIIGTPRSVEHAMAEIRTILQDYVVSTVDGNSINQSIL